MKTVWTGTLKKMGVEAADPVAYRLRDGWFEPEKRADDHPLNRYLGGELKIVFTGDIHCTACGRATKKTFGPGYCFPCSQSRAEADICIVKPELCHYHQPDDPCRDDDFARAHCFQPHVLYAALTSGLKVGITRRENIPTRWLDQGATAAVPLAELPDRRSVGLVEARLRDVAGLADKTHWTKLLKLEQGEGDLAAYAERVLALLTEMDVPPLPAAVPAVTGSDVIVPETEVVVARNDTVSMIEPEPEPELDPATVPSEMFDVPDDSESEPADAAWAETTAAAVEAWRRRAESDLARRRPHPGCA